MFMGKAILFDRIIKNGLYEDFVDFSAYMWVTRRGSAFNAGLILLQRPGAQYVETEEAWQEKYGRYIKHEATPIVVLRPFGPVEFLYDIADTYGDEIPEKMKDGFVMPPLRPLGEYDLTHFKNLAERLGIVYGERLMGSRQGGEATCLKNGVRKTGLKKDKLVSYVTRYSIVVNSNSSDAQKASVILHEIGHILCGHLGMDKGNDFTKVADRTGYFLTENVKEFEAQKVCEIVSNMLGIDCNDERYLSQYRDSNGDEPRYSLTIVVEAADKIMREFKDNKSISEMRLF